MNKIIPFLLVVISLFLSDGTVFANTQNTTPYFEDHSRRVGYKTVDEAVKEFENHCNCEVKLPAKIPEIPFTHEFGAFTKDEKNGVNDLLQIRFVNREMKNNLFKVDIRSNKLDYEGKEYLLQDGTKGMYFANHIFYFFVFEKNNLQYVVSIDKNVSDIDPPKVLLDIANSIE
ncbi:carbon monoxide dehydrogenase [Lysinibacillus sp. SGAir0095]|uniref:carbon monoxide dehydrogenase n=1 Tax=Lysinibacillus sp. SGAir0095 TaxID=2070463 RepID=UPI0010CCF685|nr:carbon monoxide dehydrogenase [Lysinibacillus sp. SGAir0095]QCR32334.1 carbon monoxide dehydrogenase [Lysinibacillus sp. SGAir0095]